MPATEPQPGFNPRLESLRGLAACAVLMWHCFITFSIAGNRTFWATPYAGQPAPGKILTLISCLLDPTTAVILFFILSGYVLSLSLQRARPTGPTQYRNFIIRRAFRLLPAMWVSVIAVAIIHGLIQPRVAPGAQSLFYGIVFGHQISLQMIFGNLCLRSSQADPVTWTICVEVLGSLCVPLFLFVTRGKALSGAALLGLLILITGHDENLKSAHHYMFCFQIGILLACYRHRLPAQLFPALTFAGGIMICGTAHLCEFSFNHQLFADAAGASLILIAVLGATARDFTWLDHPALRLLGRLSYSVYLLHIIFLYIAAQIFAPIAGLVITPYVLTAATLVTTLPAAWLSYRFIEIPCINLGHSLTRRASPIQAAAPAA